MTFKPFLRPNKVLVALEKGIRRWVCRCIHDPDLVEIVGYAGFDFVMLDMEHNRTNPETMVALIRAAEVSGLTPLVRVGANDRLLIRAAVESGAQGIVVPHVKTAEEAKAAVEASHYPPEGFVRHLPGHPCLRLLAGQLGRVYGGLEPSGHVHPSA